ncbi:hypothetical protein [Kutzneria sp. 744]|uniref:hypothetical protein n=1 Tax=Kutzneria sp. (strain 744) TaxID=345341 RepID=UPI0012F98D58|nr:hypothetical protein [Kutzneria sp. 744]
MAKLDYEVGKDVDKNNICELLKTAIFNMLYLSHRSPGLARAADKALNTPVKGGMYVRAGAGHGRQVRVAEAGRGRDCGMVRPDQDLPWWRVRMLATIGGWAG